MLLKDFYKHWERFEDEFTLKVYDLSYKTTFSLPDIPLEVWKKKVISFYINNQILEVRVE